MPDLVLWKLGQGAGAYFGIWIKCKIFLEYCNDIRFPRAFPFPFCIRRWYMLRYEDLSIEKKYSPFI